MLREILFDYEIGAYNGEETWGSSPTTLRTGAGWGGFLLHWPNRVLAERRPSVHRSGGIRSFIRCHGWGVTRQDSLSTPSWAGPRQRGGWKEDSEEPDQSWVNESLCQSSPASTAHPAGLGPRSRPSSHLLCRPSAHGALFLGPFILSKPTAVVCLHVQGLGN